MSAVPEPGPAELAELEGALAPLVQEPPPRADLAGRVMERVDAIATHDWQVRLPGPQGSTRVAAGVVALVARRAATGVDGVAAARAVVTPAATGPGVVVSVRLTTRPGLPLPALGDRVRSTVVATVTALTGVPVTVVHLHVADLADPPGV